MIRKVKSGYKVIASSGRPMGTYRSKKKAEERLKQIEMFKSMRKSGKYKNIK